MPFQLLDRDGRIVQPVSDYLNDLQAGGRRPATQRSYGMDLLRWFRFLWAIGVPWDQATRSEARDFSRWLLLADKPVRAHWRSAGADRVRLGVAPMLAKSQATSNPVTGKVSVGGK